MQAAPRQQAAQIGRVAANDGRMRKAPLEQTVQLWMALNDDQPFDQFVVAQLAGDLLPGATEQQVLAMAELQPAGYIGTPSFLKIIIEKAAELGVPLPSVKKALVSGEAFPPSLRDWFAERGIAATRQLAKRQLTWLRGMKRRHAVACDASDAERQIVALAGELPGV